MQRMTPQVTIALLGVFAATPAHAECIGDHCYDGLVTLLLSMLIYGILLVALFIMMSVARWRRAGSVLLTSALLVAFGVPILAGAWRMWKEHRMHRLEIAGQPPSLSARTPLFLTIRRESCYEDVCTSVVAARGARGIYVLPIEAVRKLDLTQPIAIAELPLVVWVVPPPGYGPPVERVLDPEERQLAAKEIDYLVIFSRLGRFSEAGPVEIALRENPALTGLSGSEIVRVGLAPIEQGSGMLSFADLTFDFLDLSLTSRVPSAPLGLGSFEAGTDAMVSPEIARQTLCTQDGVGEENCMWGLQ